MGLLDPAFGQSIASIESGGRYDLLGPVTRSGDRAYGKYQVMGANIPQWTKEALGTEMTPQEFVADPKAQDAVFNHRFGQYVEKYGPEGAAQAWFAGPGGVGKLDRKDQLGTSVASYGQRFMQGIQGAAPPLPPPTEVAALPQPAQPLPSSPIEPQKPLQPQPSNLAGGMPAYPWSPDQQQEPKIQPLQLNPLPVRPDMQKIARLRQALAQAFQR